MSEYAKAHYNVPADIGRRVVVNGKPGIIAEDRGNYIGVNFDSDKPSVISNCHPTWKVEYGEIGTIRKMTKSQKRYAEFLKVADCFENFKQFLLYSSEREKKHEQFI
jgi:hypothetical protein